MSKSCLQKGHLSCSVVSHMFIRRQRRRLNRKRRLFCLLSSSLLGRSRRPWPIFPSMISATLWVLSLGRKVIIFSRSREDVSLLMMSWHFCRGVVLMKVDMPVLVPSPVHIFAISGANLLNIWNVVDWLFSLSAYKDVIDSGSMNLVRCWPRRTPL